MTERLAAVDFGSNTVGFLVAESGPGGVRYLRRDSRFIRLSEGLARNERIGEPAWQRGMEWAGEIAAALIELRVLRVRAVGTEVLRRARNSAEFCRAVEPVLGAPLEVISGEDEGLLTYEGVRLGYPSGPLAVVDIGGGSTEIVFAESGDAAPAALSLPLGVVTMTERLGEDAEAIQGEIRERLSRGPGFSIAAPQITVLGGTGANLAMMDRGDVDLEDARVEGHCIGRGRLQELLGEVARRSVEERVAQLGIPPRRADVIVAGFAILAAIMDVAGVPELCSTRLALRHGVLRSLLRT